jgi:hypothetical protein
MKTSELTGAVLDWAVAQAEGSYAPKVDTDIDGTKRINYGGMYPEWSTDWAYGGPIIEREMIELVPQTPALWDAMYKAQHIPTEGATPLQAAMRCYVASKLGDDIEIPEGLNQ